LAVSNDGSQVVWRSLVAAGIVTSGEAMLAPRGSLAPTQQVSADAYVIDTLDEVGLFGFRIDGGLMVAIGEATPLGDVSLQKADLYNVTQGPAGPLFQNLSASSGDTTVPFLAVPAWDIAGARLLPDGSGWMIEQLGNAPSIEHLSFAGVRTTLVGQLREIQRTYLEGPAILAITQRDGGTRPVQAWGLSAGNAPAAQLLDTLSSSATSGAPAIGNGASAFAVQELGGWRLLRHDAANGLRQVSVGGTGVRSTPQLTSGGAAAYSSGDGATSGAVWIWRLGATVPEQLGGLTGPLQILPTNS
jgi:hypothetical protein